MRVVFSPEARLEFEDAERYYEHQLVGLGRRFREEVRQALPRLINWPLACPTERGEIRRLILSRLPYKLLFSIESDHVYVIAVMHQHRKPDYWINRLDQD